MRWLTFAVLTVVAITLQAAVAPRIELFNARPDLLLLVVVFLSLYAPVNDAVAAAWILGVCADLMTIERFGLIALSYGLTAMSITSLREYLFRHRSLTQAAVAFTACLMVRTAWTAYYHILYEPPDRLLRDWLIVAGMASVYTAVLTPPAFRVFLPISRSLGITRPRLGYTGSSWDRGHV